MQFTSSFHAQHSPMGAHSSFTIGMAGAPGGMAMERGSPADSAVFVGYKTASGRIHSMPFYQGVDNDAERYSQSSVEGGTSAYVFGEDVLERDYRWATDTFQAPGLTLKLLTPFFSIPDPHVADQSALKFASCPATFLSFVIENDSDEEWDGFFALKNDKYWSPLSSRGEGHLRGAVSRDSMGFATDAEVEEFCDFSVDRALDAQHTTPNFLLGPVAGVRFKVAAGERREVRITLGYYVSGVATFNHTASYWYTQYFDNIESVFSYAVEHFDAYAKEAQIRDAELLESGLTDAQQFMIAHSTRSYYGSTQWLVDIDGKPLWVVNEGEYLMMNTLDLTVDMLFFELRFNPWTVRSVLNQFVDRYSYEDEIFSPKAPETLLSGGISFAHDMGVANHFSPEGYSSYECSGLDRLCFSYMTCEQLTNWVLCAGVCVAKTKDLQFARKHTHVLKRCFDSLLRRDHPEPERRNGLMSYESSRTKGGGEITTYDSLDHSLGQARDNIYLGGKCWAAYLALEFIFKALGDSQLAESCRAAALRCSETLANAFSESDGFIPAVLDGENRSAIIPAAEALVYPWEMGIRDATAEDGLFGPYICALKRHLIEILKPGVCLYDDGAWKLSSSADNSWMSKICLNQYVVREILGITYGGEDRADAAHVQWQVEGSKFYACSDQFTAGKPIGSLYYPRILTSLLWMSESRFA
jgi:xylan 1,4-beta-xylosidase